MTLLINELISLLEKDNKSNNDNSKLIPANNNQDKLYNNLISLLSKNIEDFITATEKKEDILLRGLNDLKTKREEQDTIFASGAQYSSDETNDIYKEESDEPDKSNVKPVIPVKPVEPPKEEPKKDEETESKGLMDKFKWVLVGFGILIFLMIIIIGVYYYYFSYNTTQVAETPTSYVNPPVNEEYKIPREVMIKSQDVTKEQPSSFMSMFAPAPIEKAQSVVPQPIVQEPSRQSSSIMSMFAPAPIEKTQSAVPQPIVQDPSRQSSSIMSMFSPAPIEKTQSAVPQPIVQEPSRHSSSIMSMFAPAATAVAVTAPNVQSVVPQPIVQEHSRQSSSFMSMFAQNTDQPESSTRTLNNPEYPLQKTSELKESKESNVPFIEQFKKSDEPNEPESQKSIFDIFSTQKNDENKDNKTNDGQNVNNIENIIQRTSSAKSSDTDSTKSSDTDSTKSSNSSKSTNSTKLYNSKNETIKIPENKIENPVIKGGRKKKK